MAGTMPRAGAPRCEPGAWPPQPVLRRDPMFSKTDALAGPGIETGGAVWSRRCQEAVTRWNRSPCRSASMVRAPWRIGPTDPRTRAPARRRYRAAPHGENPVAGGHALNVVSATLIMKEDEFLTSPRRAGGPGHGGPAVCTAHRRGFVSWQPSRLGATRTAPFRDELPLARPDAKEPTPASRGGRSSQRCESLTTGMTGIERFSRSPSALSDPTAPSGGAATGTPLTWPSTPRAPRAALRGRGHGVREQEMG
jgi:hypothetical protein